MGILFIIGLIIALIISKHFRNKEYDEYAKYHNEYPTPRETFQKSDRIFYTVITMFWIIGIFIPITYLSGSILILWGIYLGIEAIVMKEGIDQENGRKKIKLFAFCFIWVILGAFLCIINKLPFLS
jgi:hypothetical protein